MQERPRGGLFGHLNKTRNSLISGLTSLFKRGVKLDEKTQSAEALLDTLIEKINTILQGVEPPFETNTHQPYVTLRRGLSIAQKPKTAGLKPLLLATTKTHAQLELSYR